MSFLNYPDHNPSAYIVKLLVEAARVAHCAALCRPPPQRGGLGVAVVAAQPLPPSGAL